MHPDSTVPPPNSALQRTLDCGLRRQASTLRQRPLNLGVRRILTKLRVISAGLIIASLSAGCALVCPRSFGPETNFPQVDGGPFHEMERPFSFSGYVVARSICPRTSYCVAPDSVIVSKTNSIDDAVSILVACPRSFHVGNRYQFSFYETGEVLATRLKGEA